MKFNLKISKKEREKCTYKLKILPFQLFNHANTNNTRVFCNETAWKLLTTNVLKWHTFNMKKKILFYLRTYSC